MGYQIALVDRAQREARIDRELAESNGIEEFHSFRASKIDLKVVSLPVGLLIYRMENYRTFSGQAEYTSREKKTADYFQTGQENESAQQLQHDILLKLAQKGASSVVPILDVLERDGQRESLLITRSGMVVNGNRRLAAMRELFSRNLPTSARFEHIKCMVLPKEITRDDILDIEGTLQAEPETKLAYDWVGDAKLLAAQLKKRGKPEAVAAFLRRKAPEVKNTLQALAEAELYLKEWAKAEGQYTLVAENGEQLFKDFANEIQGKPSYLQEAARAIAWTLFDKRDRLEGRIYNYNVTFGKKAPDVLDRLAEDLGISIDTEPAENSGEFEFCVDADATQPSYQPLISVLREGSRKDEAAERLVEICGQVLESEKEKKSGTAALKAISTANAKLMEVDLGRAAQDTWGAIDRQLDAIIQRAGALKEQLSKASKSS